MNEKNEPIAHTFEDNFPVDILNANVLKENQSENIQLIRPVGGSSVIMDFAALVINNRIGTVRMGIKEDVIFIDVQETVNVFLAMIGLFLTCGIVGAFVFSNYITGPIKNIQDTAERIDFSEIGKKGLPQINERGNFFISVEDEIDILISKFNDMIRRLEATYIELQKTQESLIQSEKLATVGTLTAGLAHEINNPVAGLQTCIRRIKEDPNNSTKMKNNLQNHIIKMIPYECIITPDNIIP